MLASNDASIADIRPKRRQRFCQNLLVPSGESPFGSPPRPGSEQEGLFAIVTNDGRWDAVDAFASPDQARQGRRRNRVVFVSALASTRDDAPYHAGMVARKPDCRREPNEVDETGELDIQVKTLVVHPRTPLS
jgi:hypothetical protein